jgi:hypothetical protein
MAQHAKLRVDTGLDIYFCDPHSPWQRGIGRAKRTSRPAHRSVEGPAPHGRDCGQRDGRASLTYWSDVCLSLR